MVATQQQLRQKQLSQPRGRSLGGGLTQRLQVRREKEFREKQQKRQREVEGQVEKAKTQKGELGKIIESLTKQIRALEIRETKGSMGSALEASSIKYGKQQELAKIKKYYNQIAQGGYYQNLGSIL